MLLLQQSSAALNNMPNSTSSQCVNHGRTMHGSLMFSMDVELDASPCGRKPNSDPASIGREVAEKAGVLLKVPNGAPTQLLRDVRRYKRQLLEDDDRVDVVQLAAMLSEIGYSIIVRCALGGASQGNTAPGSCFRNLKHEFLFVRFESGDYAGVEFLVDPNFKEQFSIPQPTISFKILMESLPDEFVGTAMRLQPLVELLCSEMAASFQARGLTLPPWRRTSAMLSKWLPAKAKDISVDTSATLAGGSPPRRAVSPSAARPPGVDFDNPQQVSPLQDGQYMLQRQHTGEQQLSTRESSQQQLIVPVPGFLLPPATGMISSPFSAGVNSAAALTEEHRLREAAQQLAALQAFNQRQASPNREGDGGVQQDMVQVLPDLPQYSDPLGHLGLVVEKGAHVQELDLKRLSTGLQVVPEEAPVQALLLNHGRAPNSNSNSQVMLPAVSSFNPSNLVMPGTALFSVQRSPVDSPIAAAAIQAAALSRMSSFARRSSSPDSSGISVGYQNQSQQQFDASRKSMPAGVGPVDDVPWLQPTLVHPILAAADSNKATDRNGGEAHRNDLHQDTNQAGTGLKKREGQAGALRAHQNQPFLMGLIPQVDARPVMFQPPPPDLLVRVMSPVHPEKSKAAAQHDAAADAAGTAVAMSRTSHSPVPSAAVAAGPWLDMYGRRSDTSAVAATATAARDVVSGLDKRPSVPAPLSLLSVQLAGVATGSSNPASPTAAASTAASTRLGAPAFALGMCFDNLAVKPSQAPAATPGKAVQSSAASTAAVKEGNTATSAGASKGGNACTARSSAEFISIGAAPNGSNMYKVRRNM